jgi:hypothetical protein
MIDAHRQHETTEQAGRDVIDVHRPARDEFALDRVLQQLQACLRLLQQGVGRDHGGHRRRRRSAHSRGQWDTFVDGQLETVRQFQSVMHGLHRAARGVALGLHRQLARDAGDRADANDGFLDPLHPHAVANGLHGMAENVEADPDVGDGGRRKCGDVALHGAAYHRLA